MITIDRPFIERYLRETLEVDEIQLPEDLRMNDLTDALVERLEVALNEWLKDNYEALVDNFVWDRIYSNASITTIPQSFLRRQKETRQPEIGRAF